MTQEHTLKAEELSLPAQVVAESAKQQRLPVLLQLKAIKRMAAAPARVMVIHSKRRCGTRRSRRRPATARVMLVLATKCYSLAIQTASGRAAAGETINW